MLPCDPVNHLADDITDHTHEWHAYDCAHEAPQAAEEQDGKHNPESRQSGGIAKELRSDNISVNLLEDYDIYEKYHAMQRILKQKQQGRGPQTE